MAGYHVEYACAAAEGMAVCGTPGRHCLVLAVLFLRNSPALRARVIVLVFGRYNP